MDNTAYLAIMALGGTVAAAWNQVKAIFHRLWSYGIVTFVIDETATIAVIGYLQDVGKISKYGPKRYFNGNWFVRPRKSFQQVCYELIDVGTNVVWFGWRPIFVVATANKEGKPIGDLRVSFIRGTFQTDAFLWAAFEHFNNYCKHSTRSRFHVVPMSGTARRQRQNSDGPGGTPEVRSGTVGADTTRRDIRHIGWKMDELGTMPRKGFSGLYYRPEVMEIIQDIRFWLKSEDWYLEKDIPWRFGILPYGKPGCGKSSFIRGVCADLDLPCFILDLASMSNEDLHRHWQTIRANIPCAVAIEDMDGVFDGRKNIAIEEGGVTFDCLLSTLDGIEQTTGILTIITTNHPEKLDEALGRPDANGVSSRPGRIDRVVEMSGLDLEGFNAMAQRILSDCANEIEPAITHGMEHKFSPAQFQHHCGQIALRRYWTDQDRTKILQLPERCRDEYANNEEAQTNYQSGRA